MQVNAMCMQSLFRSCASCKPAQCFSREPCRQVHTENGERLSKQSLRGSLHEEALVESFIQTPRQWTVAIFNISLAILLCLGAKALRSLHRFLQHCLKCRRWGHGVSAEQSPQAGVLSSVCYRFVKSSILLPALARI